MWNTSALQDYAAYIAQLHHLDVSMFTKTISCESSWVIDARGDDGNSRGLVQISSKYHPEVSDKQADDPVYAISFMANEWDKGHQRQWSCYRILLKKFDSTENPV